MNQPGVPDGYFSDPNLSSKVTTSTPITTQTGKIISKGQTDIINPLTGKSYIVDLQDIFKPPPPTPPMNCEGTWGACDFTTGLQTYSVKRQAEYFGKECPNQTGDVQPCSVNLFKNMRRYIAENTTTQNLMLLVFFILVITVIVSFFVLLKNLFDSK